MLENFVFLPAKINDLDDIYELILTSKSGLTSLPKNKKSIKQYIDDSIDSFCSVNHHLFSKRFLFVLKDKSTNKVIGISAVANSINKGNSFYSFKYNKVFKDNSLDLFSSNIVLDQIPSKWSELCSLYLHPNYRYAGIGRFLSIARFLFIFQHRHLFRDVVMAELRGISDEANGSLFWNTLMKPSLKLSFKKALKLISNNEKIDFSLVKKRKYFLNELTEELINQLGKCHHHTKGAYSILSSESFTESNYIDILDAGPKLVGSISHFNELERIKLLENFSTTQALKNKKLLLVSLGSDYNFSVHSIYASEKKNTNSLTFNYDSHAKYLLSNGQFKFYMDLFPRPTITQFKSNFIQNFSIVKPHSKFIHSFSDWYRHTSKSSTKSFYS